MSSDGDETPLYRLDGSLVNPPRPRTPPPTESQLYNESLFANMPSYRYGAEHHPRAADRSPPRPRMTGTQREVNVNDFTPAEHAQFVGVDQATGERLEKKFLKAAAKRIAKEQAASHIVVGQSAASARGDGKPASAAKPARPSTVGRVFVPTTENHFRPLPLSPPPVPTDVLAYPQYIKAYQLYVKTLASLRSSFWETASPKPAKASPPPPPVAAPKRAPRNGRTANQQTTFDALHGDLMNAHASDNIRFGKPPAARPKSVNQLSPEEILALSPDDLADMFGPLPTGFEPVVEEKTTTGPKGPTPSLRARRRRQRAARRLRDVEKKVVVLKAATVLSKARTAAIKADDGFTVVQRRHERRFKAKRSPPPHESRSRPRPVVPSGLHDLN